MYKNFSLKKKKSSKLGNCFLAALLAMNPFTKLSQANCIPGCSQSQESQLLFTRLGYILDVKCVSLINNIVEICAFLMYKYKELHQCFIYLVETISNIFYLL